jgi:hypothetical protein
MHQTKIKISLSLILYLTLSAFLLAFTADRIIGKKLHVLQATIQRTYCSFRFFLQAGRYESPRFLAAGLSKKEHVYWP